MNNADATSWLDWQASLTESGGDFGPNSGEWGGGTGAAGPVGAGGPFTVNDGSLSVTIYESAYDYSDKGSWGRRIVRRIQACYGFRQTSHL